MFLPTSGHLGFPGQASRRGIDFAAKRINDKGGVDGRCLMSEPEVIMFDEPSLGLAPKLVIEVFGIVETLNDNGISVLLVEQNAEESLSLSQRGYVLENGQLALSGPGSELLGDDRVRTAYLGI